MLRSLTAAADGHGCTDVDGDFWGLIRLVVVFYNGLFWCGPYAPCMEYLPTFTPKITQM